MHFCTFTYFCLVLFSGQDGNQSCCPYSSLCTAFFTVYHLTQEHYMHPCFFLVYKTNWSTGHHLTPWILYYLTNWPQHVRIHDCLSDIVVCSNCPTQEIVLAVFPFILYIADFSLHSPHCHLQKFSEGSAIVGLIKDGDKGAYRELQPTSSALPVEPPPMKSPPVQHREHLLGLCCGISPFPWSVLLELKGRNWSTRPTLSWDALWLSADGGREDDIGKEVTPPVP